MTLVDPIGPPIFDGSTSKAAGMLKPWSAKTVELAIAWPSRPAPKSAMLCCPCVRRIFRISPLRASTLYPTPRFPNFPKPERSRRICVALMFVYSLTSCEEIRSLPVFFA